MSLGIFLLALIPPFLYAATNHIDNILLGKYFRQGGVEVLLLYSAFLSILAAPIFYLVDPTVLGTAGGSIAVLALVGFISVLLLWCYLKAIFLDEPTVVIIYYQLVPVMGLGLGYVMLGETINFSQFLAMAIIIVGAIVLSVAIDNDGQLTFRLQTAAYMLIASTCWATESTLFKLVALEENLWRSLFWEHIALVILGTLIFFLLPKFRSQFIMAVRENSWPVLMLNISNEALFMTGNVVAAFVVLLIPVSITLLMNSFQPLFVLLLGVILKLSLPRLDVEHVSSRNAPQKLIAIVLTGVGAYLLEGSS